MEIWKAVPFNQKYEVSNLGRIRNPQKKILTPYVSKNTGYMQIRVGGRKKHSVHRLVALAFCDGIKAGYVVNHKNGIRNDNRAENLEWVTQSYNIRHGYSHLGAIPQQKERFGHRHHTSKPVWRLATDSDEKVYYESAYHARHEGFDSGQISRCCNGQAKTHKGYRWEFALGGSHRAYKELATQP